jgi:hypothetical protein
MADESQDLGQRIVQAARLAVAMHLAESLSGFERSGRTVSIGGAGAQVLTEEQSSASTMTPERPRRSWPSSRSNAA